MVRIVVASTDGKLVNQHFGRTDKFYILDTDEELVDYEFIEERHTKPVCYNGDHEQSQMKESISKLSDCQYVIVSRVGMRARNELETCGIDVYEIPGIIEESVNKLIRYIKVQKLLTL